MQDVYPQLLGYQPVFKLLGQAFDLSCNNFSPFLLLFSVGKYDPFNTRTLLKRNTSHIFTFLHSNVECWGSLFLSLSCSVSCCEAWHCLDVNMSLSINFLASLTSFLQWEFPGKGGRICCHVYSQKSTCCWVMVCKPLVEMGSRYLPVGFYP